MAKVRFSDVVKRVNINVDRFNTDRLYYIGGEHIDSQAFMVRKHGLIKGSTIGYKFHFGCNPGHILFMSRNPHLRKCSMIDVPSVCSDSTYVVETRDEEILSQRYLLLEMQSDRFWEWAEENKSGSVNYLINYCTLEGYEFDLPPIEKQRELAELLWAANDLKESYKKLIVATDEMLKAKFREIADQALDFRSVALADLVADTFPGEWGDEDIDGNGVKVLRTTNFTNTGSIDYSEIVTRRIDAKKVERKCIQQGDVILERSGGTQENPVGRVVYFDQDGVFLCNNFTQVIRFSCQVESLYMFYDMFFYYQENKAKIRSMGHQTTGIQNLKMKEYLARKTKVPPLAIQQEFVEIARKAEETKAALKKSIVDVEQVIKGLINR